MKSADFVAIGRPHLAGIKRFPRSSSPTTSAGWRHAGDPATRAAGLSRHHPSRRDRAGRLGHRGQGRCGAPARLGARSAQLQGACHRRAERAGKARCTTCSASGSGCRSTARSSCSTAPGTAACWWNASKATRAPDEWQRAYDEINDFERMLLADGTRLVKLFLHITPEEQLRRFRARLTDPLKRWKLSYEDFRNRGRWQDYEDGDRGHGGEDLDPPRAVARDSGEQQAVRSAGGFPRDRRPAVQRCAPGVASARSRGRRHSRGGCSASEFRQATSAPPDPRGMPSFIRH